MSRYRTPTRCRPAARADAQSRYDTIASGFLRYLYQERGFRPEVAGFLHSSHARAHNPPVSLEELAHVVSRLQDQNLIATGSSVREFIPFRAGLTGSGLLCVAEHGGDLRAWAQGNAATATAVTTAPSRTASQPAEIPPQPTVDTFDLSGLARVARVLLLTLPAVRSHEDDKEIVEHTAQKLIDAAGQDNPDPRRIRLLAQRLRHELTTGSLAHTLGAVLLDSLDEALDESGLPLV